MAFYKRKCYNLPGFRQAELPFFAAHPQAGRTLRINNYRRG